MCYWKGLVTKPELYANPCKIYQYFKNRKNIYEHLPHNDIAEIKPWDLVHVDLIGQYSNSIRQNHLGGAIISNNVSLTCMVIIDPNTGWFEIIEILT